MRFKNPVIKVEIRQQKSPMSIKMKFKSYRAHHIIAPMSPQEIASM
jgi:hypothetical protein